MWERIYIDDLGSLTEAQQAEVLRRYEDEGSCTILRHVNGTCQVIQEGTGGESWKITTNISEDGDVSHPVWDYAGLPG